MNDLIDRNAGRRCSHNLYITCNDCNSELIQLRATAVVERVEELTAELAQLRAERGTLAAEQRVLLTAVDNLRLELQRVKAEHDALTAENRVMASTLQCYADPKAWLPNTIDIGVGEMSEPNSAPILADNGEGARRVLKLLHAALDAVKGQG